jgi:Ca2+-binding EF-hand superfamily protein
MGNTLSEGASPMAISAMSNYTHFEKHELNRLRDQFKELAERHGNPLTISRSEMQEAIQAVGIVESDAEVLDRLFTMFDKTGDDAIYFREFIAGIAPLISADVKEKVDFALQMYDTIGTGKLRSDEVVKLLSSINRTASYFGDPCLTEQQVIDLVEDVFNSEEGKIKDFLYQNYLNGIIDHPNFVIFVTGKGGARYGQGIS